MSLRQNKIALLKGQQRDLKNFNSSPKVLQIQQRALKSNLLVKRPVATNKLYRVKELQETQRINRSLKLQKQKQEAEKQRIVKKLKANNVSGLYFTKIFMKN